MLFDDGYVFIILLYVSFFKFVLHFYATILKHTLATFTPENEKNSKFFQPKSQLYRYIMYNVFPRKQSIQW